MTLELKRFQPFLNDVIVVDGFWGGGKSVVTSLVGSLTGVEKKKIEHVYEYVCVTHALGKMSADAATSLLQIYADLSQYNNLIGREVNLRWSDDSGFRNNPGSFSYLARLFFQGGDSVPEQINLKNLALLIASHELLPVGDILIKAFGTRLKLIEVVRHPVHLFNNVHDYFGTFERSREFTLSFEHRNTKIPWFAESWADEYVDSSVTDRALLSISRMQKSMIETTEKLQISSAPILVLAFEQTVLDPQTVLTQLETFLDRKRTNRTKRVLRHQALPRKQISAGRSTSSFSFTSKPTSTEAEIYKRITDSITSDASATAIEEFRVAISDYNARWDSPLVALESSWSE